MAIYYINGSNTAGTYPYGSEGEGAKNFYELLMDGATKVNLQDNDTIYVFNPATTDAVNEQYVVDDSANTIEINKSVTISAKSLINLRPIVKLKDDDSGFVVINVDDVSVDRIHFYKDTFSAGHSIYTEGTQNLNISNCIFTLGTPGITANTQIECVNTIYTTISNCVIHTAGSSSFGIGILMNDCEKSTIVGNNINMSNSFGVGILFSGSGSTNRSGDIYENIIHSMVGDSNSGIQIGNTVENIKVYRNVIECDGDASYGIQYTASVTRGVADIYNNVVIMNGGNVNSYGILAPYIGSTTGKFNIVNNIVYYNGGGAPDAYAFYVGVEFGVFDNNSVYGFPTSKIVTYSPGLPHTPIAMGTHTLTSIDPEILALIDSTTYPTSAYDSYKLSASSECFGVGQHYENIGIDYESYYTSVVDTVTYDIGRIANVSNLTFLSNTFTESEDTINSTYNKFYSSADNYQNQFSWVSSAANDSFPFTSGNDLYDKDLVYVIKNRDQVAPFDGISCPANPGYEFSAYPGYETGIFGYDRVEYGNGCVLTTPTVTTTVATYVTGVCANGGGDVTDEGGSHVTARGVCWSTTPNPTISDSKTTDGTGTGSFFSLLQYLLDYEVTYYYRAYATNSGGTSYGTEYNFTTPPAV